MFYANTFAYKIYQGLKLFLIIIRYLSQGCSLQSIAWSHMLGKTTVRNIVIETCEPTTQQYQDIANDFKRMWNMPNCAGSIDGKHVALKCPQNSGSMFHNYKKYFSIVLMGICDANCTFTSVSVGAYGSQSDGGMY